MKGVCRLHGFEQGVPKDRCPLSQVDILVDSTTRHQLLSFMDILSGYNQIKLVEVDQEKTSFVTSQGLFCYKVMLFGLKNAGTMYQRLMNKKCLNIKLEEMSKFTWMTCW